MLSKLDIYPEGTTVPVKGGIQPLVPWDDVPTTTTGPNPLIAVAPEGEQQQANGPNRISQTLLAQIWRSVLRLENTATGELATGLVFDVFADAQGLFMLLLMNLHFGFRGGELVRVMGYDATGEVFLVESFTRRNVHCKSKGQDFVIYRLNLNEKEWEMPDPGCARRILPAVAAPTAAAAAAAAVQPAPQAKKRKKEPAKPAAAKYPLRGTSGSAENLLQRNY